MLRVPQSIGDELEHGRPESRELGREGRHATKHMRMGVATQRWVVTLGISYNVIMPKLQWRPKSLARLSNLTLLQNTAACAYCIAKK